MDWNSLLWQVITGLLSLLIAAFLPVLAGYLVAKSKEVMARIKAEQPDLGWQLERAAEFAVKAAEQIFMKPEFKEKKQYAITVAEKWLALKGIEIDLDLLDAAIEKAVHDLKQADDGSY